jgi:hypothetical protein
MAERFLRGQSAGKPAVFKNRATPADPGADADLAGGPHGMARDQFAGNGGQPAKNGVAQSVAQKLAAAGTGIWGPFAHVSTVSRTCAMLRQSAKLFLRKP